MGNARQKGFVKKKTMRPVRGGRVLRVKSVGLAEGYVEDYKDYVRFNEALDETEGEYHLDPEYLCEECEKEIDTLMKSDAARPFLSAYEEERLIALATTIAMVEETQNPEIDRDGFEFVDETTLVESSSDDDQKTWTAVEFKGMLVNMTTGLTLIESQVEIDEEP